MKLPIELPLHSPDREHARASAALDLCHTGSAAEIAQHRGLILAAAIDNAKFYLRTLKDDRYKRSECEAHARHLAETNLIFMYALIRGPLCDGQQAYL